MVNYCCVLNCKSNSKNNPKLHFHSLPINDRIARNHWLDSIGRTEWRNEPVLKKRYVCGEHFEKNMLAGMGGFKLRKNAEPTIFKEGVGFKGINVGTRKPMCTTEDTLALSEKTASTPTCNAKDPLALPENNVEGSKILTLKLPCTIDSKETDLPPEEAQETIAGEKVLPDAGSPHATNYECSEIIIEEPFSEKIILLKEVPKVKNQINDKQKPYFSSIKSYVPATWVISEICRICLNSTNDLEVIPLNEKSDSTMVNIIKTVLPDLDLDIFSNNMICSQCSDSLAECYRFNKMWLAADEKLKKVIETKKHEIDGKSDLMIIAEPKEVPQEESNPPVIYPGKRPTLKSLWGLGPYICEICGAIHNKIKSFLRHLQRHQIKKLQPQLPRKQKTKRVMCELCGHLCFTAISLKKHHAEVHQEHKCTICGKEFKTHYSLQRHVKITHLKLGCRQCHYCGKQLHDSNGLRQHLRSHSVKMYSCQVCNKKFTNPVLVKKHSRIHNPTPSSCEYCGKCVKYESSLKKHIKIYHKHEGGYKCDFCGKVYWKNWDLKRHKLLVHGYSENRSER